MIVESPSTRLERELGRILIDDPDMQAVFGGVVPIVSYVSEKQQLPYLVYNETRMLMWDDDRKQGGDHTVLVSFLSAGESEAYVKNVLHHIKRLWARCDRRTDINPYRLVLVEFVQQDVTQETDGQAYRGTAQYRAVTGGHEL